MSELKLKYPKHCIHCEGIDESAENPRHHPSYEITTRCNLNCVFCYSKIAEIKGLAPKPGYYGDLDPKAITISQFGEPFAAGAEKVAYVIDRLKERFGDVRIDVQTNGTFELSVLEGRADIVMVSLDAATPKKYAEITGVNALERVLKNLKEVSRFCYTSVRTVFMPGINDDELVKIAEIASEVDELFFQPLSIYRENLDRMKGLDVSRVESVWEYVKTAIDLSDYADVRLPGCFILNLKGFLRDHDFCDLKFLRRNAFGTVPLIRREWRFEL